MQHDRGEGAAAVSAHAATIPTDRQPAPPPAGRRRARRRRRRRRTQRYTAARARAAARLAADRCCCCSILLLHAGFFRFELARRHALYGSLDRHRRQRRAGHAAGARHDAGHRDGRRSICPSARSWRSPARSRAHARRRARGWPLPVGGRRGAAAPALLAGAWNGVLVAVPAHPAARRDARADGRRPRRRAAPRPTGRHVRVDQPGVRLHRRRVPARPAVHV